MRWRLAVCLRELGRVKESAAELAEAREVLAAAELFGPRELLGVLVERAVHIAADDPIRAAALLASVRAHRGRWVLPFAMDSDLERLVPTLPSHVGPVPLPAAAW